jgi:hypothetical protein
VWRHEAFPLCELKFETSFLIIAIVQLVSALVILLYHMLSASHKLPLIKAALSEVPYENRKKKNTLKCICTKMQNKTNATRQAQCVYAKRNNYGQALLTVPLLTGLLEPPMSIFAISLLNAEAP